MLRAFVALWFVLSVGEPAVAHACPMHGGGLIARAPIPAMPGMAMASSADSTRFAHDRPVAQQSADHSHGEQGAHHQCTCIECCVGAGGIALSPQKLAFAVTPEVAAAAPAPAADVLPRPAPPHARPLGTGPPRA